jgi:hypothetical protein
VSKKPRVGGHLFEFGVGRPGLRASVWTVWTNGKTDFFLANRDIKRSDLHTSFHPSGDWHHAIEDGHGKNYFAKWSRPAELGAGWTQAFAIVIPGTSVQEMADDSTTGADDICWVAAPPRDDIIEIYVAVGKPIPGVIAAAMAVPLATFSLPSGESVIILGKQLVPTDGQRSDLATIYERHSPLGQPPGSRFLVGRSDIGQYWDFVVLTDGSETP